MILNSYFVVYVYAHMTIIRAVWLCYLVHYNMGHFISSQPTYAPHVPNLAQSFRIYIGLHMSSHFPILYANNLNGCRNMQR